MGGTEAYPAMTDAQQMSDPRVADLVRAGKIRAGLFPPQYTRDAVTGELKGVWVELVRALGERIGVEATVRELANPDKLVESLDAGACDIGSLGFDPSRAAQVGGFTAPFMQVEYTYLVRSDSPIRTMADVDRPGIRIAAVRNHASTFALTRILKQAEQIGADTPDAAFDVLRSAGADAWASIRPSLADYSVKLPGSRVLDGSYGANLPALVVPKGHTARLAYLSEFVEEAKTSGLVQQAIERAGQPGYRAAPPAQR
jgi:polar amino acid transport system substrate-binding protein